jgi:putative transposase
MPWGLKRYQQTRDLHSITFSCYGRAPLLGTAHARDTFLAVFERVRRWYGFYVVEYVVMPEHVHLLISEPETGSLALVLQMTKQMVARALRKPPRGIPSGSRATTTSTCGANASGWRSCAISIGILSNADW